MNENNRSFNEENLNGDANNNFENVNENSSSNDENSTSNYQNQYEKNYTNRYENQDGHMNYQQDDQYYGNFNTSYSSNTNNDNMGNYSNKDNSDNMSEGYNAKNSENKKVKSKNKKNNGKKVAKIFGAVAGTVIIAFSGGLLGGYLANKNDTVKKQIDQSSYAAPQFLSSTEDGTLTVSQAIEKVKPAVVTISTKTIVSSRSYYGQSQESVQEGIGSGFIINEDGYILTNYHVISGANEVKVLLSTGEEVDAKVVNYDAEKDIAMVKLADGVKVPGVAELGDSDALYAGQEVIAIGTPLSTEFSATSTKGIVSAINRNVETDTGVTMNLIQTDAAINPGNSGGPLINSKGQVIGINSMKLVTTEVEGIGFSIPINEAKDRIETLSKPIITLGISVMKIDEETAKKNDLTVGLLVKDVTDFSPAQKAGIKIYDVITEFNGKKIETTDDLTKAKEKCSVGDKVKLKVERDGKEVDLEITLE